MSTLSFDFADVALPLDLPEIAAPVALAPPPPRRSMRRPRSGKDHRAEGTGVTLVDASTLVIDERFGLDEAELAARYAQEVAEARARLAAGRQQNACPVVMHGGNGTYRALTALPAVIAAREVAVLSATPVMVQVIVWDAIDGEVLVREMFGRARPASLFQQARYIAGCEALYGSRREWMRAEGIDTKTWEPRFSKIAKVGRLDPLILDEVDPHSITNAEVAGRIVDAWDDPDKQQLILVMVEATAAAASGPVKAGPLFKRIDAALHPTAPAVTPGAWTDGVRELVAADGTPLARLTREGSVWSIAGGDLKALTPALLRTALQALSD